MSSLPPSAVCLRESIHVLSAGVIPMRFAAYLFSRPALFVVGVILAGISQGSHAALEAFFGSYEGVSVRDTAGEITVSDSRVEIKPFKRGFTVTWVSVTQRDDGRLKRKDYSINFEPTKRGNVYASAMRVNMFGDAVPMDPLKGDPYFWATVNEDTLTVNALHITDGGDFEIQVYERRLIPEGLELNFSRLRQGQGGVVRRAKGVLRRVE